MKSNFRKSLLLLALGMTALSFFGCKADKTKLIADAKKQASAEPALYALFETEDSVELFKLFEKENPIGVKLFAGLAIGTIENQAIPSPAPFYNNLEFYIASSRLIKSGSPNNKDKTNSNLSIPVSSELKNHNKAGLLSLSLNSDGEADGRYIITLAPISYLDSRPSASMIGEALTPLKMTKSIEKGDTLTAVTLFRINEDKTETPYAPTEDFFIEVEKYRQELAEYQKQLIAEQEANLSAAAKVAKANAEKFLTEENKEGVFALIKTNRGSILLELEYKKTPLTVSNFVGLAEGTIENNQKALGEPYYNGLKFHRVIPNFMIQGGCPLGTGTGDPGYSFRDELDPTLKHDRAGILSMANSGPTTNGSQFFITHEPTAWLDGKHTVFGHVIEGQEVVDAITQEDQIDEILIIRMGADAQKFRPNTKTFNSLK